MNGLGCITEGPGVFLGEDKHDRVFEQLSGIIGKWIRWSKWRQKGPRQEQD